MGCEEVRESLGAYVLGGLEPEEIAEVRRHLQECPACRSELRELEAVGRALDAAPHPADPPPHLEEELLSRMRAESSPLENPVRERLPRKLTLLAASFAALVALVFFAVVLIQRETSPPVATVKLEPAGAYASGLRSNGYWGVAKFYAQGSSNERVELRLNNLRPSGRGGGSYEAWIVSGDKRLRAGTFRAEPSGQTDVWLTVPSVSKDHRAVLVTRRPAGSPHGYRGEVVLRGEGH